VAPVNATDMVLLPEGLKALKKVAIVVGVDLCGAYLNLDGGFDSAHNRKCIFNAGLIPNIPENPRNRKHPKRGRKRLFNATIHALRLRVERTFPCSRGLVELHDVCLAGASHEDGWLHAAMLVPRGEDGRRGIMAGSVQHIDPVAHCPCVLGVLRRLAVATLIDRLLPPHPAQVVAAGWGGEAVGLAVRDGAHALYQGGPRLEERGRVTLLQPGRTRASRNDDR
jgi:hypothetical protein